MVKGNTATWAFRVRKVRKVSVPRSCHSRKGQKERSTHSLLWCQVAEGSGQWLAGQVPLEGLLSREGEGQWLAENQGREATCLVAANIGPSSRATARTEGSPAGLRRLQGPKGDQGPGQPLAPRLYPEPALRQSLDPPVHSG